MLGWRWWDSSVSFQSFSLMLDYWGTVWTLISNSKSSLPTSVPVFCANTPTPQFPILLWNISSINSHVSLTTYEVEKIPWWMSVYSQPLHEILPFPLFISQKAVCPHTQNPCNPPIDISPSSWKTHQTSGGRKFPLFHKWNLWERGIRHNFCVDSV